MQNIATLGCSRESGSVPEIDPRRGSSGDSEGSSLKNSIDSRGSRILALAAYIFLSLLGHPGPARGEVRDASLANPPFNIPQGQVLIFEEMKLSGCWGGRESDDPPKERPLITIEGGLAIFRNVNITENAVQGVPLIDISGGGVMLVQLTKPGDYFRVTRNIIIGDGPPPVVRASAGASATISPADLEALANRGFSPLLASLAGKDRPRPVPIRLQGTKGALFRMTGNPGGKNPNDLISNAGGGLLIMGPLDLWYDSRITTKDLFIEPGVGLTSSKDAATLSMEIRAFDCPEPDELCNDGKPGHQGGIIKIVNNGIMTGVPSYLIPMPGGKIFSKSSNKDDAHYFEYLEFGTGVDAAELSGGEPIGLYPLMPKLDLEGSAIAMGVVGSGENKNRVIYYVNTLGKSIFHYGSQSAKVTIETGEFHIFRGDTVQGPIVFSGLDGGVIAPTYFDSNAHALLLGSAKFQNIGSDNISPAVVSNMGKLFLVMPRDGDRIEFSDTSGGNGFFFDIAAVNYLYMTGVTNSRVVLDGAGMYVSEPTSLTLGGAVELDIGSHSIKLGMKMTFPSTANENQLWPSLYLTVDFSGSTTTGGQLNNSGEGTTVSGGSYIIPRVPNDIYISAGQYEYTYLKKSKEATLTLTGFSPKEKTYYGIGRITTSVDTKSLVFDFTSGTRIISGRQTTGLTVSGGNVITSEMASEPPHFDFTNCGTACGAAIDVEAGGSAYLVGSTLFEGVKGGSDGGVLEVASGGRLEIHLPERSDTTEFRSTASGVWDIHNLAYRSMNDTSGPPPVIIEGVEGSRVILSGGIGGVGGSLIVEGPVQLEPGLATIYQKDISFGDKNGFPKILISSLAAMSIYVQAGGTLVGEPQLILAFEDGTLKDYLGGRDHRSFSYAEAEDGNPTFTDFNPMVTSAIEGSVVYGAALDPDALAGSFAHQKNIVIYRKLRIISGSQSERIVVYGGRTVVNSDLVSFKNIDDSANPGGALRVAAAGTLELDGRGTAGPIAFEGNRAKSGGAIHVDEGGDATLRGSFLFRDNKASTGGGAIYSEGTINFLLGAGDTVSFKATTDGANDIVNGGKMALEGVLGSVFELGEGVKLSDGENGEGTLSIRGRLKLLLAGSIVQSRVSFPDPSEAAEFPTVAAVLEKIVGSNSELSGGTISAMGENSSIKGKIFLDPMLPAGIHGGSPMSYEFASYPLGTIADEVNDPLLITLGTTDPSSDYTATVGWSSADSLVKRNVRITFRSSLKTKIISGQQPAQIVVPMENSLDPSNPWSLVTNRDGVEPVVFSNMVAPALKVAVREAVVGKADLRAPLFDSVKSSGRTTGEGVIEVDSKDNILALYALAGETIEFRNTLALLDIYSEGTTQVTLSADSASLILSRGIGGDGELSINGPGQVLVRGSIEHGKIYFRARNGGVTSGYEEAPTLRLTLASGGTGVEGDRATPTLKLKGDGLEVQASGSIDGHLNIALAFANGMEHFTRGEFSYLTLGAGATIQSTFNPRISKVLITNPSDGSVREEQDVAASKYFTYGAVNYDLAIQDDKKTIVLWGDLRGTIGEKFVVHSDKKIYGATFNGLAVGNSAKAMLEIGGGKTATVEGGGTTFSDCWSLISTWPGAVEVKAGGTLRVNLPGADDRLKFEANGVGTRDYDTQLITISDHRDIKNEGTLELAGAGTLEFEDGGIRGDRGLLNVLDSAVLDIKNTSVTQKTIRFAEGTTLALEVKAFDVHNSALDATAKERRGTGVTDRGGMLIIPDGGTGVTGSPKIWVTLSGATAEDLTRTDGGNREYKYLYSTAASFSSSQKPTLLSDSTVVRDSNGKFVGVHIGFLGDSNFQILTFSSVLAETAIAELLEENVPAEETEEDTETIKTFFNALLETDGDTAEEALKSGAEGIREIFQDNNPDSHVASQSKGMAAPIQDMAMALDDRMEESMASQSPEGDLGAALLLAAGDSRLTYGLMRGKSAGDSLHSRVWTKILLNSGTLKLEEERKVSGSGFLAGLDHRVRDSLLLGVALGYDSVELKGGGRTRIDKTYSLSLYGNYSFSSPRMKNLHLSGLLTGGMVGSSEGKLSSQGYVIYMAPTLSYGFTLVEMDDLRLGLRPELGIRYFYVHQGEQKGSLNTVAPVSRSILGSLVALRVNGLLRDKFELSGRVGFSYDLYEAGDSRYNVTMHNGSSYQLAEIGAGKAKLATELGASFGYRLTSASRVSIGYGGRFSSELISNSIRLEASFSF